MITVPLADEAATNRLGADIAAILAPGDSVGLVGDLGAGKTTLARAILRALANDPAMEVPSPTFTLVQIYDEGRVPVRHADLYRLQNPAEADELGLGEPGAADLIEWPQLPQPATITLTFDGETARTATISGEAPFVTRLARLRQGREKLPDLGALIPLKQDASTRNYFRTPAGILMDAPAFTPPADSYLTKARLADGNMAAFLCVGALLNARGIAAPTVRAIAPDDGFLLLEDFGDETIAPKGTANPERYLLAAEALAHFHQDPHPKTLDGPAGTHHTPPTFDADLAAIEVALYPEWARQEPIDPTYIALWRTVIDALPRADDRLALRDVHAPNLLWRAQETGIQRVGFIDYQDAMVAPSAYDVVSLAQDARVPIDDGLEAAILARYFAHRPEADTQAFRTAYHVLGAERAARIAGVFHRLDLRDGKPHYRAYLPNVLRNLSKNLAAAPALAPLAAWFAKHPPQ
ncbi:MAG: tRNA (adenosine(37)-N6)-threonylcarbamoyltransferase complex ATPase subunit type 1 TsaE [Pseudomonadota bacterium]